MTTGMILMFIAGVILGYSFAPNTRRIKMANEAMRQSQQTLHRANMLLCIYKKRFGPLDDEY